MQQCHGKDKATTSAIPYHAKGKTAVSVMPCHGKDKAATSAMRPKDVFTDDDIVQEHIPPSDRIRQRGLNRDTCSMPPFRPKEMADTRSSCVVPRKHLGKEGSLSPGMGLRGEMLQKGREKVHTGPIPQKHNAKEKTTPPDQLRGCTQGINQPFKTESTLAGEMSQKRTETPQEHSTKEKACPPDQLRGCMQGIKRPVKTESPLAGEMSQKRTETPQKHSTKEKACPPDQLRGRMQGIKLPVKTESPLAGEMSQKRTETPQKHSTKSTKEKTCPRDQLRGHTHGIKQPVKTEARISHKPMEKVDTGPIPQKHNAMEKMCPPDQLRRQMQGIKRPVKTEAHICQKQREKVDTGSIPQKLNAMEKTCPPDQLRRQTEGIKRPVKTEARMSQKQREKADTSLIPQKHNAMEKTCPPDQLRHRTQCIQRPVKTEARLAGEKKHTKSNTSFPTERTTPQLRTRTSSRCSNACTSRPIDAHDHGNTAAIQKQREKSARIKVDEDVEEIIQKLNKLGLGEDISFEEYYGYLEQLPLDPRVDTSNKLDLMGRFHMDLRHAVYRIRSYKLLNKESKNELCRHELKECPMDLLDKDEFPKDFLVEMQYFRFFQKKGVLDWFFDPDLPAGLNDYQRLVPHDHGHGEYAFWGAYRSYFHSYEMQLEYIKYFETLLRELEWLKDCLPRKFSSRTVNKIRTRGIYQATKIATRFSNITPHLARIGFDDCFTYMSFEATWCNGSDDLYFEIWKRVTQQKNAQESFRNTLKEVYELNKCPSLQESIKYAIEDDCSVMKRAFLRCTAGAGITKEVPVDEAQPLIAEAVKKLRIKPIFYDGYIRKKIDFAKPIGVITENAQESIRDTLKEDHNLNECPSLQDSITYAIEDDCSVMERAFLCCTAGAGVPKEVS